MTVRPLRIVFAGTPSFAERALAALLERPAFRPIAVYTQPDRPAGRGMKLTASPVKALALTHAVPVRQPETLRDPAEQAALAALAPEVMVVAAYGLILPQAVLDIPRHGCLNIHASLLPRWRGAAPIERAILAGDVETGVSVMQMEAGLDTGPVLAVARTPIGPEDTAGSLHERLAELGAATLISVLEAIARGERLEAQPQPSEGVTYAAKIRPEEARIDWSQPAEVIERAVRAFDPRPGAWTTWRGEKLKVWRAAHANPHPHPLPQGEGAEAHGSPGTALPLGEVGPQGRVRTSPPPGTVLALGPDGITVATGAGCLRLTEVQRPGGRRMPAAAWLAGGGPDVGERFGV
ncbi:MAG: methionyl-tRNA formyltransferase [Casimicrobiaceae bacterium]|nr:methionyl-tRNA formyltransferase [Casimicrobiaceae bacterium]